MDASPNVAIDDINAAPKQDVSDTHSNLNNNSEAAFSSPKEELWTHEFERIKKQRKAYRFANPAECYFYHHIPIHWTATILHCLSLLISISIIALTFILWLRIPDELAKVEGLGTISNITLLDIFYIGLIIYFIGFGIKKLFEKTKLCNGQSYRVAMLSNAFTFIVIQHLKLTFYTTAILSIIALFSKLELDKAIHIISEGAFADAFNAFLSVISLTIFYRGFRPCYYGVEE